MKVEIDVDKFVEDVEEEIKWRIYTRELRRTDCGPLALNRANDFLFTSRIGNKFKEILEKNSTPIS